MPDIFLSYNREDQATARRFAEAFQGEGFEVWWDTTLRAGEAYDEVTEHALNEAKAVVVLWSPRSVGSRWVRAEATQADRNRTLVPVTIEPCKRPIMFELTQTADLSAWDGSSTDKTWRAFLADVTRFVQAEGASVPAPATAAAAPSPARAVASQSGRLSICVLPFANMSRDDEQEYFADGISEDIITDLSKVSALSVIARNSAFAFKGKNVDLTQVARQLSVTHVLEGSVRKSGNRVRITAQLINGATNDHLWAERWDRDLDDIFALQDEISQAIVNALKLKLLPEEKQAIEGRGTASVEAYDVFMRARALHATVSGPEVIRAVDLYRRAVELDPDYAQAWAGLAAALAMASIFDSGLRATAQPEMEKAFARAAALAPELPNVRSSRIAQCSLRRDWAMAEELLAAVIDQGDAWIGLRGQPSMTLCALGRADEAADLILEDRQADPLSIGLSFIVQFILGCAGRLEEAEAEYERSKDLPGNRANLEWRAVSRAMVWRDPALVKQRFVPAYGQDTSYMPFAPRLAEAIDRPDEALAIVRAAFDDPSCQDGARQAAIAHWAAYYGDDDLVLKALRRGFVDLGGVIVSEIWSPVFVRTRRDPRFKDIVRDLRLADHWRRTGKWGDFARPVGDDDFQIIR
jgi:TolB-like protein